MKSLRQSRSRPSRNVVRFLRAATLLALIPAVFAYGVGVGVFQWFPYSALQTIYQTAVDGTVETAVDGTVERYPYRDGYEVPDGELLRFAFTNELSLPVLREPATSLEDILEFNKSIHTPIELFFEAPDHIELLGARQLDMDDHAPILVVDFLFGGHERRAYAYGALETRYEASVLMIPGSGENKARRIVSSDHEAYHCCLYDAFVGFDRFVQIKPNEGIRAVHDGEGRLHEDLDLFINWHLNRGSSYSSAYIVEAVALAQFLSERSEGLALVGLSQGGIAALLSALLEPPDVLIVASGYSTIASELVEWAGHVQVITPGVEQLLSPSAVVDGIGFPALFTYGLQERGLYRIEAETGRTCTALARNDLIECSIHDGGHEFSVEEVVAFLDRMRDG